MCFLKNLPRFRDLTNLNNIFIEASHSSTGSILELY